MIDRNDGADADSDTKMRSGMASIMWNGTGQIISVKKSRIDVVSAIPGTSGMMFR